MLKKISSWHSGNKEIRENSFSIFINYGDTYVMWRKLFGQFFYRRHDGHVVACRLGVLRRVDASATAIAVPSVWPRTHPNELALLIRPSPVLVIVVADLYYQFGHLRLVHNTHTPVPYFRIITIHNYNCSGRSGEYGEIPSYLPFFFIISPPPLYKLQKYPQPVEKSCIFKTIITYLGRRYISVYLRPPLLLINAIINLLFTKKNTF